MAYKYKNFTDRTDEGLMKGFTGAIPSNRSTEGYKSSANSPDPRKMNWNVNPTVHNSSITKKDDTSLSQISGLSKEPYTDENGNIVQMSTNSSDDGKPLSASQYEKALEEYNSGGSQALNVYVAGLKSQGVSDTALEQLHQTIYGQSGYSKTDAALKRQITDGLWKIDNDESGGTNWFWGINHNRNYIDPYTGKSVTTDELIERLMSTGMTEAEAKDFIQKNLPQGSYDTENEGTHAKQKE